ncbi:thioesterase family protein [Stutzerimonas azotifigens]|uniref:Thioesterase n=1 Tax=Stutzerimonas azotifigens TaxID=291995 RepID=A0ABR5YVQ1_9GAMM|nr:thioesterase family protein [Stutzerimonas azotifigens]MBA1272023.1 thioesterase [Stutzerimonas azotifigens]
MAGLLRNLLVLILALLHQGSVRPAERLVTRFRVTPLDIGLSRLKSDRYLQLTEAAQLDFLMRTGLIGMLIRNRYNFVNASATVRYTRPITLFSKVSVASRVVYSGPRFAYFEHRFEVSGVEHACVLIKMKFKQGRQTIEPSRILGPVGATDKPEHLQRWDDLLDHWP